MTNRLVSQASPLTDLRTALRERTTAMRGPTSTPIGARHGAVVEVRALNDYDDLFNLTPAPVTALASAPAPDLEVV